MLGLSLPHLVKEAGTAGTAQTAPRLPWGSPPHTRSPHGGCQPPGTGHSPCRAAISAPEAQLFEPEQEPGDRGRTCSWDPQSLGVSSHQTEARPGLSPHRPPPPASLPPQLGKCRSSSPTPEETGTPARGERNPALALLHSRWAVTCEECPISNQNRFPNADDLLPG